MRKLVAVVLASAILVHPVLAQGSSPDTAQPPAQPATPDPIAAAQSTLAAALDRTPMSLPVVAFVTSQASGYGMYQLRPDSRFKSGEAMHVYVEPLAFKARRDTGGHEGDQWTFGVTADFAVLNRNGDVLVSRTGFLDAEFHSHRRNTELMFNATVSLESAPPGDYQLELTVHDKAGTDVARARLPFTVEAGG